jgi:hypothetical protein
METVLRNLIGSCNTSVGDFDSAIYDVAKRVQNSSMFKKDTKYFHNDLPQVGVVYSRVLVLAGTE